MFEGLFQPMHLVAIFGIALLVFGPKKLPELARESERASVASKRPFKIEMKKNPPAVMPRITRIRPRPPIE